jgi:hypothetical protein
MHFAKRSGPAATFRIASCPKHVATAGWKCTRRASWRGRQEKIFGRQRFPRKAAVFGRRAAAWRQVGRVEAAHQKSGEIIRSGSVPAAAGPLRSLFHAGFCGISPVW